MAGAFGGAVLLMVWGAGLASRDRRAGQAPIVADVPLRLMPDLAFPAVAGLTPLVTSPDDHYTVDINLARPRVDGGGWRLSIDGLVRDVKRLAFSDLLALETREMPIHLHCISNIVAGDLMGNATWVCVSLGDVIDLAGPEAGWSTMIVDAADGYRGTLTPDEVPGAWLAVGMGGAELPDDHGFPVRLLLPGRYGMRSVKWVTGLRLVPGNVESYWAERGWDAVAPLRTGSRIDVPEGGTEFDGTVTLAGLAWAAHGVERVELSHDGGASWSVASLEKAAGPLAWRRWHFAAELPPGEYEYAVRAVSGGLVQDQEPRPPHPSGASGYHRRTVRVR
ncbi:MAG TPA: molybdopterin-dependent oxidoreductase [Tepidiformaceae bacterium]|nr:molybdopterin-dependent oxidoreductase [Tepidiformaceae bacterium]